LTDLTLLDVIESFLEMKFRQIDTIEADTRNSLSENKTQTLNTLKVLRASKTAYSEVYQFIGSIRMKKQTNIDMEKLR